MIDIVLSIIILALFIYLCVRAYKEGRKVLDWAKQSLESDGRASARKISAMWMMVLVTIAHSAWLKKAFMENDFSLLSTMVTIDLGFIALCLGLKTAETIFTKKPEQKTA